MKEKNNRYVIRGNKWVVKTVPSTKQIEEKPTNISIECKICSRMADKFVRIVRIDSDGSNAYLNGICCDRCVFTWKAVRGMYIIDGNNKVITPETITLGQVIPTNDKGWLDDIGKGEQFIKDRDRYRNSVMNMIRINKALGTYMPTYKQEMEQKIQQGTYLIDELDDDLKREIYKRIKSGEIKI